MAWRQFLDVFEDAQRVRYIAQRKVRIERFRARLARYRRVLQQRFQFGSEDQSPGAGKGVIKRLLTSAITRYEKRALLVIPDRKRKHAAQVIDAGCAVLLVGVNYPFSIGTRLEDVPVRFQLSLQLLKVVDLAVEDDSRATIFARDWLMSTGKVDDRQAPHAEGHPVFQHEAGIVRSTIPDDFTHVV